ncbi:MAG: chemotaxis protein CheW [Cyanobacteriota bacterium]
MHDDSNIGKFIVFRIADYYLALPLNQVIKVVNFSPTLSSGLNTMGVIQLGRHMIRVLDLREQLNAGGSEQLPPTPPFLVITRTAEGQLCGIGVEEPPNLVELPLDLMRSLPKSDYSNKPALNLVSHAAVVSQENVTMTIFLLDVERFLKPTISDSPPLALKPF